MNKQLLIYAGMALVAVILGVISLNYRSQLQQKESAYAEQLAASEARVAAATEEEARLAAQERESARLTAEAQQAHAMALAQAEEERRAKEAVVAELNTRLAREAADRKAAEAEQAVLADKIAALQAAQAEARTALLRLEAERATRPAEAAPENASGLSEQLARQDAQLSQLAAENERLREKQAQLLAQQMRTEEAIVEAGGRVQIPYPEIRSPYVKRREALYFKERVAGHDND